MMLGNGKSYKENANVYYDLSTGAYERYFGENIHLFLWKKGESREQAIRNTNEMFIRDARISPESHVVDLGCGIGALSILVAKKYGCRVTGININRHQLKIARKKAKAEGVRIDFLEKDIMKLDLDEKFDAALFIGVEPHLPDKRKAVRNIRKILKKNTRIVMTAWLQSEKLNLVQREFLIKPLCRIGAFSYLETFPGYRSIFRKEGFKIIKFRDITPQTKRCVDEFYARLFKIIRGFNSLETMAKIVKNTAFLSTLKKGELRRAAEDIFKGPIYAKLCMDAGVLKLGYFVVEKK